MIYFLQHPDGSIKIGTALSVTRRRAQLESQLGCKLVLLGVIDGSHMRERELHRRFSDLLEQGEWFRPGEALLAFIAAVALPLGDARLAQKLEGKGRG